MDNEKRPVTDDPMDIVDSLRGAVRRQSGGRFWQTYFLKAADEIERLRAAGDALAAWAGHFDQCIPDDGERCWCGYESAIAPWTEARRD
jgi:hypothetical protein